MALEGCELPILLVQTRLGGGQFLRQELRRDFGVFLSQTQILLDEHRRERGTNSLCVTGVVERNRNVEPRQLLGPGLRHRQNGCHFDRFLQPQHKIIHGLSVHIPRIQIELMDNWFQP